VRASQEMPGEGRPGVADLGGAFLKLGFSSFGGPIAHLGYFQRDLVEKRRWLDAAAYADMVALCQFLPGPTSSQVAFGIGMRLAGLPGALAASICFMLPSAAAMILFGTFVGSLGAFRYGGWLHGLMLAAVAVVAWAVWGMATKLCPDWPRRILAIGVAAFLFALPGTWGQVGAIAACGFAGSWISRRASDPNETREPVPRRSRVQAAVAFSFFVLLLAALPILALLDGGRPVMMFDSFYRSGSLVFGGGHVVLPLLRTEVVPRGWISEDAFLAGYGAAQAIPGPLFTFAGYLGAVILPGRHAWAGGLMALSALFLPGFLLVTAAYPVWHWLRGRAGMQGALRGANAAVVGILLAALVRPLSTDGIRDGRDLVAAAVALVLLGRLRTPPWVVVALMAAAGQWLLR
jgi:chromate transporter